jgi:signal transduction histidine kinase
VSEEALRRKIARKQQQVDILEAMIEDRSRAVFTVNEELAASNARLQATVERLAATQKQLVEASRKAGMADVATTVLHNVGNVLNGVNVSAEVVAGLARSSKGAGLKKAVALLRAQPDPGRFMTEDPRGQKLIEYLGAIADALDAERERTVLELDALSRNIEHIKAIVSRQQSHAKSGGVIEKVSLREMLEDALKLNAASDGARSVIVVRDYGEVGDIEIDRHKLFQILMNLLSNARHALEDRAAERRLIVRTRASHEERVAIDVEDNGIGIPRENLERIFSHGFTTKTGGHGFGLHSSACAAIELGGALHAHSEGVGEGARFTVTVPRVAAKGPRGATLHEELRRSVEA